LDYDDYHLPYNHKAFGFAGAEEGVEERSSIHLGPQTPYDPTNASLGITTTVTGGESQQRGRSVSIGSRRISLSFSRNASPSPHPSPPLAGHERRPSYDHKRDTQFEEYVLARRASQRYDRDSYPGSLQDDVNRALSGEFGFSDLPSPDVQGELVTAAGVVPAAHVARPRVSSFGRQTSWEVLVGGTSPGIMVTTPPDETLQRGHSLNSVPEAHEEEDSNKMENNNGAVSRLGSRKRTVSESQQALLGESRGDRRSSSGSPGRIEQVDGLEDIELESKKRRRDS
jgi:hypothetical protein